MFLTIVIIDYLCKHLLGINNNPCLQFVKAFFQRQSEARLRLQKNIDLSKTSTDGQEKPFSPLA
jgi:hypothetical protein